MSKHLQRQIETLKKKILTVGTLVEEAIAKSVSSLIHRDAKLAEEVISADDTIDASEVDVEEEVLKTLALHQPVAADLRFVIAVLKINNDLERMGDIARNISKRVRFIAKIEGFQAPVDFRHSDERRLRAAGHRGVHRLQPARPRRESIDVERS